MNLKRSRVTGVGFSNWDKPWITALFLDGSPVDYQGLQKIRGLPGLQALSLRKIDTLTPECLHLLATGSNVSTLFFSGEQLNEQSLKQLSDSATISSLEVGEMTISAQGIESILAIKQLRELKLSTCKLTESAFERLHQKNSLQGVTFLAETIDAEKLDKILKVSVPNLGFHEVIMEPTVLQKLKGNTRVKLLRVTSPGITTKQRVELKKSFPKNAVEFDITDDSSLWALRDKAKTEVNGLNIEFINSFDH